MYKRQLLFGQPGADGWAQLYAEIDEAFADDLMPSEQDNEFVVQARKDRRMQLVDALVAAADRLVAADDAQEGLWFARAALRRDRTREDAYKMCIRDRKKCPPRQPKRMHSGVIMTFAKPVARSASAPMEVHTSPSCSACTLSLIHI